MCLTCCVQAGRPVSRVFNAYRVQRGVGGEVEQGSLTVFVRILAAAAIVIFCGALFVSIPRPSTSAEVPHETAAFAIDFSTLHAEAAAALQALEQSRKQRLVSAISRVPRRAGAVYQYAARSETRVRTVTQRRPPTNLWLDAHPFSVSRRAHKV